MQRITTFLTFSDRAEDAVRFYVSIFKNSKITQENRYGEGGPGPKGSLMTAAFELDGQPFVALNGGPSFHFSQGISLLVNCETQDEVDHYWDKLTQGGKPGPCGWLTDRFGVSWQVVPAGLGKMLGDKDPAKAGRVAQAMMKMGKLELPALVRAYEGR